MNSWRPQQYRTEALYRGGDPRVVENATKTGEITVSRNQDLTPVLSLRHLAYLTDVPYNFLREIVSRNGIDHYQLFRIHKKSKSGDQRYRVICIPDPRLLRVQKWIAQNILRNATPHRASTAFSRNDNIVTAAKVHTNARWLIKLDVENFFESITEISAYRVFLFQGYQPLVAFELARVCTRQRTRLGINRSLRWCRRSQYHCIPAYVSCSLGYLPQGAPTSPMLSNLSVREFDNELDSIASLYGLNYSRYADDICFSTQSQSFSRKQSVFIVRKVYKAMVKYGLSPNRAKTQIIPPGARKVVLGLLVDGECPRLSREFKSRIRMHLYYLNHPKFGPNKHAKRRGFDSVLGLHAHVRGLIAHAQLVEPHYANACLLEFNNITW